MKFMTEATLRNMPTYLAEARARRTEEDVEKRRLEDENKREAMTKRMRVLGQEFMRMGNYTPEGLKNFAEENEMSMPEMKGMVDMVMGFKALEKEKQAVPNVWSTDAQGVQTRVPDMPGVTNILPAEKADRIPNVWAVEGGRKVRRPDVAGLTSDIEKADGEGSQRLPDYVRYARDTLKDSLGYGAQTGWPDKQSENKFNTVLDNVTSKMRGANPADVNKVLFNEIDQYDQSAGVAAAVKNIPKDTAFTTTKDAKTFVDRALGAGADPALLREDLKAKGWDDKKISEILSGSTSSTNPLGL